MKYGVIVADPPWTFQDKLQMDDVARGAASNYLTMNFDTLCTLPVSPIVAPDAFCLLWCPAVLLAEGLTVLKSWGFQHKQVWTWVKVAKNQPDVAGDPKLAMGMGHLARNSCEFALVGTRGKILRHLKDRSTRNVFFAPNLGHSIKPEKVQDAIDRMFPDLPKLEIFARRQRWGWECCGLECPTTLGEDVRHSLGRLENLGCAGCI